MEENAGTDTILQMSDAVVTVIWNGGPLFLHGSVANDHGLVNGDTLPTRKYWAVIRDNLKRSLEISLGKERRLTA